MKNKVVKRLNALFLASVVVMGIALTPVGFNNLVVDKAKILAVP